MIESVAVQNWAIGTKPAILQEIVKSDINITIYDRDISALNDEITQLMNYEISFKSSGKIEDIISELSEIDTVLEGKSLLVDDIQNLLSRFKTVSGSSSFRVFLGTVNTNMCRKFHTDINDLRMLCTYTGPGTLWLTEDNLNRNVLNNRGDENDMVINQNEIQQAKQGSVLILKGAIFPEENTKAIVHRSPTIEETGERRLLLRIDTNDFLNF